MSCVKLLAASPCRMKTPSHVKNSENDVRLSDGFNVAIDRQFKKSTPPVNAAQAIGSVVLCDGYNRCAFLTAEASC